MTSRLAQMQMRFQQRQQQERDQRKVEMISSTKTSSSTIAAAAAAAASTTGSGSSTIRTSAVVSQHHQQSSSTTTTTTTTQQDLSASLGAGKVRQMFDERRHGQHRVPAGIDKSYPLQPIKVANGNGNASVTNGNASKAAAAAPGGPQLNNKTRVPPISANTKARLAMQQRQQQQENGNCENHPAKAGTFDDNENLLEDEKFPDTISFDDDLTLLSAPSSVACKLPNVGKLASNNNNSSNSANNGPQNVNSLKLKPVPGRTPTTTGLKTNTPSTKSAPKKTTTPAAVAPASNNPSPRGSQPNSAKKSTPVSRASTGKSDKMSLSAAGSRKSSVASMGFSMDSGPVPDGLIRCTICGRNFAEDRIQKHREICQKTKNKKRRVFDATKHRVQGTDAEKYVNKKKPVAAASRKVSTAITAAGANKKNDWRRKHEEFIQAIRAAKEMQAHLAKGGKLSDLPPPPPSENPDYVQCPHCSRRFNQTAAERHIPKCATMLHNKPKPGQAAKGKRF